MNKQKEEMFIAYFSHKNYKIWFADSPSPFVSLISYFIRQKPKSIFVCFVKVNNNSSFVGTIFPYT